jgi:putative exporter of polyketide antibiotics
MADTRIVLSGLWVATMLVYLLGDVLRIFAGDMEPGKLAGGVQASQAMWMLVAVIMLVPIAMLVLTLTLSYPAIRWINIAAPILVVLFNIAGLPYKGAYDNFLIAVSFAFNVLPIWMPGAGHEPDFPLVELTT